MLLFRRIDHSVQWILGTGMLISLPGFLPYGFLAGLFLMGCWQLFSASLNTKSFLYNGLGKEICSYWKFTGLVFACLFLCIPLAELFDPDDVQVLGAVAVSAGAPIAVYYLLIYKKLIHHPELRKELGMTQEQLAAKCGTTKTYISRIENDASDIRLKTLMRIINEGLGGHLRLSVDI